MKKNLFDVSVGVSFASIVVRVIMGWYTDEIVGYLFFGFMISAVFINISVILSEFYTQREIRIARIIWVCYGFVILFSSLLLVTPASNPEANREIGQLIGFPMAFLSMPTGILGTLFTSKLLHIRPLGFYAANIFDWFIFISFGYAQWFLLYPRLIKWIKNIKSK